ncbi:radical SAM protein [Candidatus Babeliales bacterium]|nr:radical SAM protein [Candidatus Babeliales bacterium]
MPLLEENLNKLFTYVDQSTLQEMTIEVNPEGVTHEMLKAWKRLGFTRLSVGVQVLDDQVLNNLNRRQTTKDVLMLFDKIFDYGFDVSADLIIGLPGVSSKRWWQTVHTILQWPINHVSVYFLTIHENTPLAHRIDKKELSAASDDEMVDLYQKTILLLERHGLKQYEISNFARTAKESIHNRAYWQRKSYKGFGIGAASFYDGHRFVNQKNLTAYVRQWEEGIVTNTGRSAPFTEELTESQQRLERYMLGLRQTKGISMNDLMYQVDDLNKQKSMQHDLSWLQEEGFLIVDHDMVRLTPRGMVYENEIVTKLY